MKLICHIICFIAVFTFPKGVITSDITHLAFGGFTDGMPAAFGDFNSDELTDVFVVLGKTILPTSLNQ